MSRLVYVGEVAGLVRHEVAVAMGRGGDMNHPANYNLLCSCRAELGPLAKFRPNENGDRSAYCTQCHMLTILDKHGRVVAHVPIDLKKFIEAQMRKACEPTKS